MIRLLVGACLLLLAVACQRGSTEATGETVRVFGAASLTDVMVAAADSFEAAHKGVDVVVVSASSSVLARQIASGAPADVFMTANPSWSAYLDSLGLVRSPRRVPVTNRLAVYTPAARPLTAEEVLLGQAKRIAVGDPDHVPVGRYARAYLECVGIWAALEPSLIPTADVRAALQTLRTGAVDAAIAYTSDAAILGSAYRAEVLPAACQPDIVYEVALVGVSGAAGVASDFVDFLLSPERRGLWTNAGFIYLDAES